MTAMSFRQQQKASQGEFSLTRLICIAALFVVATTLHGCGEKCPKDGVPFTNGKVFFKCKDDSCTEEKLVCNEGCGKGGKTSEDMSMQFLINTADECVLKFTKEPRMCHKCNEGGVLCQEVDGVSIVMSFGEPADGAKDPTGGELASGDGNSQASEADPTNKATDTATDMVVGSAIDPEHPVPASGTKSNATGPEKPSSLLDIRVHDHVSNSVQIASADVDAKQSSTVSSSDVHVHHDEGKPMPEAPSLRQNGLQHQKIRSNWAPR